MLPARLIPYARLMTSGTLAVLRTYLGPLWGWVGLLAAALLLSTGLSLTLPGLLARFVDEARLVRKLRRPSPG